MIEYKITSRTSREGILHGYYPTQGSLEGYLGINAVDLIRETHKKLMKGIETTGSNIILETKIQEEDKSIK